MNFEAGPGLPPHIALLLNEKFPLADRAKTIRHLKGMRRDLRNQIEATPTDEYESLQASSKPDDFRIVLSGGLDLFGHAGACMEQPCRMHYADQVARTVALMGDDVLIHDHFSQRFEDLSELSGEELSWAASDIYVLNRLKPLIKAGIVKFSPASLATCSGCRVEFEDRVTKLAADVARKHRDELRVFRNSDGTLGLDGASIFNPPLTIYTADPNVDDETFIMDVVSSTVRSILWDARDASYFGGAVFSNSAMAMTALMTAEARPEESERIRFIDGMAASKLPWIAGLSIEQTLILRQEAQVALPRLREFLAKNLTARADAAPSKPEDYVAELREQAEEVKAELAVVRSKRRGFQRGSIGVLSLSIATAGMAAGVMPPVVGAAQLLTTLGLLHSANDKDHEKEAGLKGKPGYVLVAAQQILAHAPQKRR